MAKKIENLVIDFLIILSVGAYFLVCIISLSLIYLIKAIIKPIKFMGKLSKLIKSESEVLSELRDKILQAKSELLYAENNLAKKSWEIELAKKEILLTQKSESYPIFQELKEENNLLKSELRLKNEHLNWAIKIIESYSKK